jgi:hypothetical protein
MWVHAKIWLNEFAATMRAIRKRQNMVSRGSSSIVKALPLARKQHNASDITRQGEAGMNLTNSRRAVAAATGRRFKSSRPDMNHRDGALHLAKKPGMKIFGLIISVALVAAVLRLHAQDAAPPSVDLYEGQNQLEPTSSPEPPNGPELPEISQLDQNFSKPRSLGKQADEARVRVEWRQLKNRTANDSAVQAAKVFAQSARTDLEKRNRLRNYYNIYYERMSALATTPELKLALQALKTSHQGLLDQPRVRPSPTPEGATPTPTPSGTPAKRKPEKKHKKQGKSHKWF